MLSREDMQALRKWRDECEDEEDAKLLRRVLAALHAYYASQGEARTLAKAMIRTLGAGYMLPPETPHPEPEDY